MTTNINVCVDGIEYAVCENIDWQTQHAIDSYSKELERSLRFDKMFSRASVIRLLIARGLLEEDFEKTLVKISNQRESNLIQIFLSRSNPTALANYRQRNKSLDRSVEDYRTIIDGLMPYTKEYLVSFYTSLFLTSKITTPQVDESNYELLSKIQQAYLRTLPSVEDVRAIAKAYEWRAQWGAKKHELFRLTPLSTLQCSLANLSQMYDNAMQHPDAPDDILELDDDIFDGWMLWSKQEKNNNGKGGAPKKQHQETFIVVKDQEEANIVHSSNSAEAQRIQQSRMRQLEKNKKMNIGQFSDVQERRLNESRQSQG